MDEKVRFSVIVPVYNRIDEVRDLLESLSRQTLKNFEVVIVEDGSTDRCQAEAESVENLRVRYFYKENEGRSIARNYGMERAAGDYFIFFDSDCVIPEDYFAVLSRELDAKPVDCFGGPDSAHSSFTSTQKAINFAMTSFLTTGGIRGGKMSLEKFVPRTFNMGFSRRVYERVGGFREMFSEDIDMSTRIRNAGFSIALIRPAYVYHKRRVDFRKFLRQVYVFGMSRITLKLLYPGSLKVVHALPALAVIIGLVLVVLSAAVSPWFLLPLGLYLIAIFVSALVSTRSPVIAVKALPASVIQICGYGCGFLKAYFLKIVLGRGRDVEEEILMRKGK
ncbi:MULTISPECIES: glycosyltransferase [Muribaculaceae]|jgi:glycosyltransferase involved in cell wall biosynthesis|uniref:Glycosyl transferase family 2 n=2 Tax=Duncaniella muris TaxID=2094150 RepID=A0A2V1ITD3_9BACT|nr:MULTISPECIES: glycosyltransferase [Muribaculaceae]NBH92586.1 glycosyltransferase [Muribaculaceae bacterium S4]NBI21044.1 glycosyltransferase [Muribaculaceae bacterium Z1]ROS91218.1 glycosyltransferase [Muribaculaceae bacterium Isolate-039 (Harlan)]ROS94794.1 glycosyltransferase [Muribaculaceae bacterium Isolate-077 (Janvier)]ROS97862.1 glycosyltransferase [Muribaculaceae bacterium Isolate-084 (Janvier)]ROS98326.1 glycosyltransferase [Muribaculaceae bacterium Isolate-083 (Janvier)]GFI52073